MDKHCRICHNTSCSNHGKNISFLGDGWKCNYIPVTTNADRIRAMNDEELAFELMTWRCETAAKYHGVETQYPDTQQEILSWLQQPAEQKL